MCRNWDMGEFTDIRLLGSSALDPRTMSTLTCLQIKALLVSNGAGKPNTQRDFIIMWVEYRKKAGLLGTSRDRGDTQLRC